MDKTMKKITQFLITLALLHTQNTFCMLVLTKKIAQRSIPVVVIPKSPLFYQKSYEQFLRSLEKERHTLEAQCYGHGGLVDLMSLGPDESLQEHYRKNLKIIEELQKRETIMRKQTR